MDHRHYTRWKIPTVCLNHCVFHLWPSPCLQIVTQRKGIHVAWCVSAAHWMAKTRTRRIGQRPPELFWFFSSVSRAETTVKVYDGFDLIKGKDNTPECSSTSTSSPSAPIIADNNKEVQRAFGAKIFEGLSVHLDLTSSFFRDSIPVSSYQIAETYPTHELLSVLIILVLRSYLCPKHNGCKQGKQKSLKRYHQGHIFFF